MLYKKVNFSLTWYNVVRIGTYIEYVLLMIICRIITGLFEPK